MKKIIYAILLGGLLTSCVKLDEDPRSQISTDNFYKTQSDAVAAVQSIYNDLTHNTSGDHASIYNRLLVLSTGMMTDNNIPGPRATNPDVRSIAALTQTSTNTRYYELWRQHYEAINRANTAIDKLPSIKSGDTAVINRLILEAKFLRGLLYYNLVRLWGDVPLITHATAALDNLKVSRTPANEVYTQIISDLKEAIRLPQKYTGTDAFRATGGAARSLLLSVSVTRRNWADAIDQYNAIANGGFGYDLETNFGDIFSATKKFTKEHIFDATFIADGSTTLNGKGNTNILSYISAPINGFTIGDGAGGDADAPIVTLRGQFKKNDKRAQTTFNDSVISIVNGKSVKTYSPHFYKYWDVAVAKNPTNNGVNVPVTRFAEVLLFYAEAQNELNGPNAEAYTAINRVRNRAGLDNLTEGLTKDQFRDSLFQERNLEFVYEQIRWFDLIRTNGSGKPLLVDALKRLTDTAKGGNATDTWTVAKAANVSDKFLLLPIPASEIIANPQLTQNHDW